MWLFLYYSLIWSRRQSREQTIASNVLAAQAFACTNAARTVIHTQRLSPKVVQLPSFSYFIISSATHAHACSSLPIMKLENRTKFGTMDVSVAKKNLSLNAGHFYKFIFECFYLFISKEISLPFNVPPQVCPWQTVLIYFWLSIEVIL